MKKYNFGWIFLMIMIVFATSCKKDVDENIKQSTFFSGLIITGINVDGPFDVKIIQDSTKNYMVLEYSAFAEDKLDISINNFGVALVKLKKGLSDNPVLRATIYANSLETIDISGAATVSTSGTFYGYQTEIDIEEASTLTNSKIETNLCTINISEASSVSGNIHAIDDLILNVSEASNFSNGFSITDYANIVVKSASTVNMLETEVRVMKIELEESSEAHIFATEELTYKLSEFSTLYYKGTPVLNEIAVTEGSSIHHLP
ncbi:MAG: DUF2807 domain-containing protein [Bacteroidales bacterium]|nr:DUF2807 domain-containing protein [Bacteroidales bacterium]